MLSPCCAQWGRNLILCFQRTQGKDAPSVGALSFGLGHFLAVSPFYDEIPTLQFILDKRMDLSEIDLFSWMASMSPEGRDQELATHKLIRYIKHL
jgi:hypothetical protein